MVADWLPIFLFAVVAVALSGGLLLVSWLIGPARQTRVKEMPYESGMDPIHDARRRFDVRFHLVAIAFLVFDVELLFLYPWAVATRDPEGINRAVEQGLVSGRGLVFVEVLVFIALWPWALCMPGARGCFSGARTARKRGGDATRFAGQLVPQEQSVANAVRHGVLRD